MPTRYALRHRLARLLALGAAVLAAPATLHAQAPPAPALPAPLRAALRATVVDGYLLTDARWQTRSDPSEDYEDFLHARYTIANGRYTRVETEGLNFTSFPPTFGLTSATGFTYGNGSRTETHYERRGNDWEPTGRTVYTFSGDRVTQIVEQAYRPATMTYADSSRTVSTYGGDVFPTETLYQLWTGTAWASESRTLAARSGASLVITDQDWNGTAWVNANRTTVPYDAYRALYEDLDLYRGDLFAFFAEPAFIQAQYVDLLEETWDGTAGTWVNDARSTATRDGQGRVLTRFLEDWDGTAWTADTRDTLTYTGDRLSRVVNWNYSSVPTGERASMTAYTYDGNGNVLAVETTSYDEGEVAAQLRFLFEWAGVTAVDAEAPFADRLGLATYPNPARDVVTARFALPEAGPVTLRVLDLTGREVARVAAGARPAGDGSAALPLGGLPAGLYVLRLETAAGAASRPLTLVR